MELIFDKTKRIIALLIVAIIISFGSSQVFAATKYYPEKDGIKKGSQLLFTGNSWYVYPSKEEAKAAAADNNGAKHCSKIIYKNTRIVVREVSDYILRIGANSYIIYGKTGSKYFKQEKIYTEDIKKGDKLKFTGNGWYVYPTTGKALQIDHDSSKEKLRKNDVIEVKGRLGNVLKIDDNKYIYYGGNANKYFEKISSEETFVELPDEETFVELPDDKVKVTGIKLNTSKKTLTENKTYTLKATVSPSNATNKEIKWTSSNTKVAKVSSKGVVTAVGKGTAKITATSVSNKKVMAECTIIVELAPPIAKDSVEATLEALGLDSATIQKIMKVVNNLKEADKQKLIENISRLTDEQKAQLVNDLKKLDEKEFENYIKVIVNMDEILEMIKGTIKSVRQ